MKKKLIMMVSLLAIFVLTLTGTVAYFTDTDSKVNVAIVGNIDIELHEKQRTEDKTDLEDFVDGQEILPAVYKSEKDPTFGMSMNENYLDKIVYASNVGNSDAYMRVIIAVPTWATTDGTAAANNLHANFPGDTVKANFKKWMEANDMIVSDSTFTLESPKDIVEIDGQEFFLMVYTFNKAIAPGETTLPTLLGVYLDDSVNYNPETGKYIGVDGKEFAVKDNTLYIPVMVQGVQAGGFENADTALNAAFGEVKDAFKDEAKLPAVVEDAKALDTALASGGDAILTEDLKFSASETTANSGYGATGVSVQGGTLDGAGNSLGITNWGTWDAAVHTTGGTIKNLTINSGMRGIFMGSATEDVYIDNVVIDGTIYTFNSDGGSKDYGVYISNSTLNGWTSHSDVHKEVVYTNCNFGEGNGYAFCRPYGPTTFVNCVFEEGFEFDTSRTSAITFENCYYGDTLITADNAATLSSGETTFFYNGLNGITIK